MLLKLWTMHWNRLFLLIGPHMKHITLDFWGHHLPLLLYRQSWAFFYSIFGLIKLSFPTFTSIVSNVPFFFTLVVVLDEAPPWKKSSFFLYTGLSFCMISCLYPSKSIHFLLPSSCIRIHANSSGEGDISLAARLVINSLYSCSIPFNVTIPRSLIDTSSPTIIN